ncbi:hypothetical protein [Streptomyces sp. NPDC052225]|uniref:hypothetical protein n=1 Tax=Streptomyces sp. NPDC052225 TaxID=3154949 RepID=UPI00342D8801
MAKHRRLPAPPPTRLRVSTPSAVAAHPTGGLLTASASTGEREGCGDFVARYRAAHGFTWSDRTAWEQSSTSTPGLYEAGDGFGRVSA